MAALLATLKKTSSTITLSTTTSPLLRWNSTGITVAGISGVSGNTTDKLNYPWSLTFERPNILYVSDRNNHRVQKFVIGIIQGSTVAGLANNTAGSSSDALNSPVGIVVDDSSSLYIADEYNYRIQLWSSGASSGKTIAGNTSSSGNANNQLNTPTDIALDSNTATLYIADSFNHRVMRYLSGTSAGTLVAGNNSAGTGNTQLWQPTSVYFDSPTNSLLIANTYAHNIVRWVLGDSCWTLVAGNLNGSSGNTFRELQYPRTVTLDPMGNVYVADTVNHRIQFFLNGETNGTTIAGHTGSPARNATGLFYPSKIVLDSQLNLYVADTDNQRIQKFLRY